jgi:site-specific DNA recombinase
VSAQIIKSSRPEPGLGWPEAAVYARRSTEESRKDRENKAKQIESTIQTQTQGCLALARDRRFRVAPDAIFQEHFTGMELWDRPALTELRARIRAGIYKALICHSTDRLARHPIHIAIIAEECERAGCELIFVTEPLDNSPEAALIRYIKGYAAMIEREKFRERVKRQRAEIISKGSLICSGGPKYGYLWDKKNRQRVLDPKSAEVVHNIFTMTIGGMSGRAIADKFQREGVPTPSRRQDRQYKDGRSAPLWNNSMISRILNDESYTGKTFVNMHRTTDVRRKNGKMKVVLAPREEWVLMPDGITPPIITEEMFLEARRVIEENKKGANYTRNSLRPFLLRGMIFCSACGNPMYPEGEQIRVMRNRTRTCVGHVSVYRCSHGFKKVNRLNPGIKCDGGRVYATEVEKAVWDKVLSFLAAPEVVVAEVEKALSGSRDEQLRLDLASAKAELAKINRVRATMLVKYQEAVGEGDPDLAEQIDRNIRQMADDVRAYKALIDDLKSRLAAYEDITQAATRFAEYCALVNSEAKGEFTFEEKRAALQAFRIKVFTAFGRNIRVQMNTGVVLQTARGFARWRGAR